jgi:hypothetical protein
MADTTFYLPGLECRDVKSVNELTSVRDNGIKESGERRMEGQAHFFNNRRRHFRFDCPSPLEICLIPESAQRWDALARNVSAGGLCLHLYQELSVGQRIEIKESILPFTCKTARVCWVKETGDGDYLAGLELLF